MLKKEVFKRILEACKSSPQSVATYHSPNRWVPARVKTLSQCTPIQLDNKVKRIPKSRKLSPNAQNCRHGFLTLVPEAELYIYIGICIKWLEIKYVCSVFDVGQ